METRKQAGQLMQCPCGLTGFGVEPERTFQSRERTFRVTAKDSDETHTATFTLEDRRFVGVCRDTGRRNRE